MTQHKNRKKLYSINKKKGKIQVGAKYARKIPPTENEAATKYTFRVKKKAKGHDKIQLLKTVRLKAETEGLIIAAQDQSLATRCLQPSQSSRMELIHNVEACGRYKKKP